MKATGKFDKFEVVIWNGRIRLERHSDPQLGKMKAIIIEIDDSDNRPYHIVTKKLKTFWTEEEDLVGLGD